MGQFKIKLILLFLILLPLAILTGVYDLEISKMIVNRNSGWANFLENFGMIPGILVIMSGVYIRYLSIKDEIHLWSYIQKVVFFLVGSGLTYYLFEILLADIASDKLITFIIISFALNLVIFILLHLREHVQSVIVITYSKVVVSLALFGYVICIQGVKYVWGRVRFRELDAAFSQFTLWYLPQGFTGFDSFPSGHAAMGWMLLPLLILCINRKKWVRVLVFPLILIWGIILACSRVVVGAHFASDVLFGSFFIIITLFLLSQYHVNKFQKTSTK